MGMSNALVVSAAESASGQPARRLRPADRRTSRPQILMEQDVHAPGLDARGAAFPGVNLYVQLGRGQDYAWSATSAGQDIIDTFAVDLCEPDGCAPTDRLDALPLPRRLHRDRGPRPHELAGRRRSPTPRRPAPSACTPSARSSGSSAGARRSRAARSPTRGCARRTCTRSTPRSASRTSTTPARCTTRRASSARRTASATRSTGSTPTTATSPTSTRATTRSARPASPASCRCPRACRGAASTPSAAPPPTRRSPSTRRRSTASRT